MCNVTAWAEYVVELTSDAPVVAGGTVKFSAKLLDDGNLASGSFKYYWQDNSISGHSATVSI